MMDRSFRSTDASDLVRLREVEKNAWDIPHELSLVDSDDGLTWQLRRLIRLSGEKFVTVQSAWDLMRRSQGWKLEQPMMMTARFWVKRVIL